MIEELKTKLAGGEWRVGDRVSWRSGTRAAEGKVVRVAFQSGRVGDLVFDASDAIPRYIVETDDGRLAAYCAHTLSRAFDRAPTSRPPVDDERLILVDARDRETGFAEKLRVHREGLLHRAFSVFIFDSRGRLLLQKRAAGKYHSAGLWSNTACGHPRPGEATTGAARRRLREEMRIECGLRKAFSFIYRAQIGRLVEHEYDHVFVGVHEGEPAPDPAEVEGWRWIGLDELRAGLQREPEHYSYWLRIALENDYWLKPGVIPPRGRRDNR